MAGKTENLTELENLNEATLLAELQARYRNDVIYTYVGEILVAVNPFKTIEGIYSQAKSVEYTNIGDRASKAPHIFAVADSAFASLASNPPGKQANQVCVISGESGAGKTESAKLFIKQIIHLSTKLGSSVHAEGEPSASGLEEKIVQLNPLLEAFGNAQTLMNDNSSRFGKFIELRFNENLNIMGVLMYEYLLEKSRVIAQGQGEQNFHVFYLFYSGLTPEMKSKYFLNDPSEHRFMNSSPEALKKINTKKFKDMWLELVECMNLVGFEAQEVDDLWALLAGVLHTGDLEFGGEDQASIVSSADQFNKVCECLGVENEGLKDALTTSVNIMRGENVVRAYKVYEAEDVRDAMAKGLYGRAFSSIVKKANELLGPKEKKLGPGEKTVGILDIFGFECFQHNSFEQLLINLANEQLQFFFNNHIFKMELDEYAREGIDGSKITFEDNVPLLEMLLGKPKGLLAVCDEEAFFPKGTDESMLEKFHAALNDMKGYERPRGNEKFFSVHHYAGKVTYQAVGFLEKNRDSLAVDVVGCLRLSENELIRTLFGADAEDAKAAKKAAKTKAKAGAADVKKKMRQSMKKVAKEQAKAKRTTVGTAFKESLADLMTEMSDASPHFIRCIKPNMEKQASLFNGDLVTKQLRYTGMLETTRIRKEGFSYRPTFADFVARYKILGFSFTSTPPATMQTCDRILAKAGVQGYQVGHTKVFLRYFHTDQLNEALRPFPNAANKLSKACRGFMARKKTRKLLDEAAAQRKLLEGLMLKVEKSTSEMQGVLQALAEEDGMRPPEFFQKKKKEEAPVDKNLAKFQKSIKKQIKKEGFTRAASVRWFKEVEMKKGAGMSGNGFQEWFHGVITRKDAEDLLKDKDQGTFLVRVSESRFGYSLSHVVQAGGRIKHYMIDQTPDGQYQVVGNRKLFPSLNNLVEHHKQHKIVSTDPVPLIEPCGQVGEEDDLKDFKGKK